MEFNRGLERLEIGVLARTIAVIDDDNRVLESLQNLLASCGYKAETYSSAELFLSPGALSHQLHYHRCRDEADERLRTSSACQKQAVPAASD